MGNHPRLSRLFWALALVLSHIMCAVVASQYTGLLYCGRYGLSAVPASTAFLLGIPIAIGILISLGLAWAFREKKTDS